MAKNPIEKEKETNPNTPGAGLSKSQETIQKTQEITNQLNDVKGKLSIGLTFLALGSDTFGSIRSLSNKSDEDAYDAQQELKNQSKGQAIQKIKERLPNRQEIIDKLSGYSCDLEVIRTVKKTKNVLENGLNHGKGIAEDIIKKLEKLKKKMEKAAENIAVIAALLAVFSLLITVLEILVTAVKLSLVFFTGIFAAGFVEERLSKVIDRAEGKILKYTEAIKGYVAKSLKILGKIMIIFNLIPKIIQIFSTLLNMITKFLTLIAKLFKDYIKGCIPAGELITNNGDGTQTINNDKLDNFLNSNLDTYNTNIKISRYSDYTLDTTNEQRRIYKPEIKPNT